MARSKEARTRTRAFVLSWIAYATYYLGRKSYSVTKARIQRELGFPEAQLAAIDTVYLVAYALGQFLSGVAGDRIGARRLVGVGMLISAAACALAGLGSGAAIFFVAFAVNGLSQSTGWPGTTKTMAAFTTPSDRGAIMGLWSTCYQVGGVAATALAALLLARSGWRAAFLVPSLCVAIFGVIVLRFLPEKARLRASAATPDAPPIDAGASSTEGPGAVSRSSPPALTDGEARRAERSAMLRSVTLWSYGCCYFCLKLIRYSLLFWLPYYLFKVVHFTESQAGYLSTSFEVGGVCGAAGLGLASDRARGLSRPAWAAFSSLLLAGALFLYAHLSPTSWLPNALLLGLVGALLYGPDALIAGAAAQDAAGSDSAATATGIVNGVGSVGAILQGYLTVTVSRRYGWSALFHAFVWLSIAGAACLVPAIVKNKKDDKRQPIADAEAPLTP